MEKLFKDLFDQITSQINFENVQNSIGLSEGLLHTIEKNLIFSRQNKKENLKMEI